MNTNQIEQQNVTCTYHINNTQQQRTGSTSPLRVISPVMATSDLTHFLLNNDTNTVAMVTPADGPSFPTAPAGKWMWISFFSNNFFSFSMPSWYWNDYSVITLSLEIDILNINNTFNQSVLYESYALIIHVNLVQSALHSSWVTIHVMPLLVHVLQCTHSTFRRS